MEGLTGIHNILGGLVVVAFIIVVILAAVQAAGRGGEATRTMAMIASGIFALQIVVGLVLLGSGRQNTATHYIIALLILIPLGLLHSAGRRLLPGPAGVAALIWSLAAGFLAVIAYLTGMQGVPGS